MDESGNYNETAPSPGFDPDVAYYLTARPLFGDRAVCLRGRSRFDMQMPKPQQCNGKRAKLTVGDLFVAAARRDPTPAEASMLARREYRRATEWWADGRLGRRVG